MKRNNIVMAMLISAIIIATAAGLVLAHEHRAPHNGTLVELGDEFAHLELVFDSASGRLTAYVLDGEAENPVRIKQASIRINLKMGIKPVPLNLMAVANPLSGEVKGDTSVFSAATMMLKGSKHFMGTILLVTVKGTIFSNVNFQYPQGNEDVNAPTPAPGLDKQ